MQTTDTSTLSHYLRVLKRGAWIVALTTLVVTGIAIALSVTQRTLYEAHADVFLSGARSFGSDLLSDQQLAQDPERASNTQSNLARVPAVARRALRKAGLRDRTPADLLDNSSVSTPAETDILRFTVTDEEARLATGLSTAYAAAYTDYRRELDTGAIVRARRQIERRLDSLDPKSELYQQLATEDQRLRTAEALQGSNVAVVRRGTQADQIQPKPVRNAVLGGMLGLVLGIAFAFAREALNTRIRSPDEAQERLGLRLIGRIGKPSRAIRNGSGLAMTAAPHGPEAEAYRMLATNLGFANLDRGARSIMVTSATDGEGKSTTVANLALALARSGSRVTLVDLDLKRPSLDRLFSLDAAQFGVGATAVALGKMTLEDALIPIALDDPSSSDVGEPAGGSGSLDLLLTGAIPPDTAQFVASPQVGDMIRQLTERSDLVLLDSPPILQTSDAIALTGKVDAVLLVTRLAVVQRSALDEVRHILADAPVAKLGLVLTGAPLADGYGYGYGHHHGGSIGNGAAKGRRRERVR